MRIRRKTGQVHKSWNIYLWIKVSETLFQFPRKFFGLEFLMIFNDTSQCNGLRATWIESPDKTRFLFLLRILRTWPFKRKLGKETTEKKHRTWKISITWWFFSTGMCWNWWREPDICYVMSPTLSMTAFFMLTIVSQKQPARCHERSSNLLVTWAFEDVDCSVAAACRLVEVHFFELAILCKLCFKSGICSWFKCCPNHWFDLIWLLKTWNNELWSLQIQWFSR